MYKVFISGGIMYFFEFYKWILLYSGKFWFNILDVKFVRDVFFIFVVIEL